MAVRAGAGFAVVEVDTAHRSRAVVTFPRSRKIPTGLSSSWSSAFGPTAPGSSRASGRRWPWGDLGGDSTIAGFDTINHVFGPIWMYWASYQACFSSGFLSGKLICLPVVRAERRFLDAEGDYFSTSAGAQGFRVEKQA